MPPSKKPKVAEYKPDPIEAIKSSKLKAEMEDRAIEIATMYRTIEGIKTSLEEPIKELIDMMGMNNVPYLNVKIPIGKDQTEKWTVDLATQTSTVQDKEGLIAAIVRIFAKKHLSVREGEATTSYEVTENDVRILAKEIAKFIAQYTRADAFLVGIGEAKKWTGKYMGKKDTKPHLWAHVGEKRVKV